MSYIYVSQAAVVLDDGTIIVGTSVRDTVDRTRWITAENLAMKCPVGTVIEEHFPNTDRSYVAVRDVRGSDMIRTRKTERIVTEMQADEFVRPAASRPVQARCYCCREIIPVGDASWENDQGNQRHPLCPRKLKPPRRLINWGKQAEGSDKRRRSGGHGYSGGDGFTDL